MADLTTGNPITQTLNRIIGMSKGEIVFDGPPQKLEDSHLLAIYGGEGWLE